MSERSFSPGDELGHHRLIEKIGAGGQGEVWRARDLRFERDVAIKILPEKALADPGARARFRREARAVGKLNHPNIATAHDFGDEPVEYLVTEYIAGSGLDDKLSGGALPEETVLALGVQLAAGLEAAHREGIIHRDLKPGNLRITQNGTLKILDFGLAEMFDPTKDAASLETVTINMTLTGTLPYMAPEQFSGISDQRSDLWSAGAVLYEMATGQLLFPEAKIHEVRDAILNSRPKAPREVNSAITPGLEQVILGCLEKKPENRCQSATELREDLQRLLEGRKTRNAEKQQGKRFALAVLAIILIASVGAGIHYWPQIREKALPGTQETASQFRLLAILPVDTGGEDPSDNAMLRGMAETVSANIARATLGQQLQLIPPSELIARGANTTDAARREFGVERVLEVTVQRSGDKVRVTCSLIDSKTHRVLNACTVTGNDADLFALQDTLAGEVIAMLPAGSRSPYPEPTEVQAAVPSGYEFYLKGRGYLLDYQKPENIDAAIKEFEHALRVSPNYAPAYAGLGDAYWQRFKFDHKQQWLDKATTYCEQALTSDQKSADGHLCLGNVYRSRGAYAKALAEIKLAVTADPGNVLAVMALGDTYDKLDDASQAEAALKRAITMNPNYWAAYNWAGYFYYGRARYADAGAMFRKASELAPGNQLVLENIGDMYLFDGRYEDAIDALQRSISVRPMMPAYSDLGETYYYLHRYPDAIAALEKARKLKEDDYLNWGNLGDALYWSPDRRSEASQAYKRALELATEHVRTNPKDQIAQIYIAEYSAMIGDRHTATSAMQKALAIAPHDPEVLFRAALVCKQLGDDRQALNWLRKAADANYSRTIIRDSPDFATLAADADFQQLISPR
jgi:eukaryotic-like serine/threonine-protein kinase